MEKYTTSDLYLSAFLKLKGYKFNVEKNGKKVIFIFDNITNINSDIMDYLNDNSVCNPMQYSNSIKNLKNLIYNL